MSARLMGTSLSSSSSSSTSPDGDHEDDHEADPDIAEEQERDEDDGCDGEAEVPPELGPDDDVSLPAGVDLDVAETVRRSCFIDHSVHCIPENGFIISLKLPLFKILIKIL